MKQLNLKLRFILLMMGLSVSGVCASEINPKNCHLVTRVPAVQGSGSQLPPKQAEESKRKARKPKIEKPKDRDSVELSPLATLIADIQTWDHEFLARETTANERSDITMELGHALSKIKKMVLEGEITWEQLPKDIADRAKAVKD